ncbi:hypothetical protein psyc5s11_50880 [Clostridium gelidum]|uniref:Uncharacterized protein n=1 Tax=Clostridium gelidum TaxID=704125 RepID=A0ABM7TAM3_9CLOT|nr:hypothetical protein [Clostridium gelidum]BCZ49021.1 hypothetical protein psyc5s11_50880 [Clostridium gelidum]
MLNLTFYHTEKIDNSKDFFKVAFVLIDDICIEIIPNSKKSRRNISECKLSHSKIITLSIVTNTLQ